MTARHSCIALALALGVTSCGPAQPGDDAGADAQVAACSLAPFEVGDPDGHADPLGVGAGEARAGRVTAAQLPDFPSGLQVWQGGDFVLANEHVAMVVEDVGVSELYDPWGGRPVGVARVQGGALVAPADFGEILILAGRMTVLTQSVTVLNDGGDGAAAVVRARGPMRPLPFFEEVTRSVLSADFSGFEGVIDYVLEPGARHVDVFVELRSETARTARSTITIHGFMHTPRMPPFAPGLGFEVQNATLPYVGFADMGATSFAYIHPAERLGGGLEVSGFFSNLTRGFVARTCQENRVHHAQIVIGGDGVDGLVRAVAETQGRTVREVTGRVRDASGATVAGAWVLASDAEGFVTRGRTDAEGTYSLGLPSEATGVQLSAFRRGDLPTAPVDASGATVDLELGASGQVHVTVVAADDGAALPARVQLLPASGAAAQPGPEFGIPRIPGGRIAVDYPEDGDVTLRAPAGVVRVVVSRGFEYELVDREVTVTAGETVEVSVMLERVVDTAGVQCGDFHIHTHRSNDSGDTGRLKLRSAIADGVEIPVRSEHEYPLSFASEIADLGVERWAYGVASVEMTSFVAWGHMGVVPLDPQPDRANNGTPRWQSFPSAESPDTPIALMQPPEVFSMVRSRPEAPVVIINHPRGPTNYFTYAGYDPVTGDVALPDAWDEQFGLVEVFNDKDWRSSLDGVVADWLSFLRMGRRVYAVGSSDSHAISRSPVGYPRTCLRVGTDRPDELTPTIIRDALAAGHSTISGGVYVDAWVGSARPGDEATGLGARAAVRVRVQAASWIDVDAIDVVVDGAIVQTIPIPSDPPDPLAPTVRFDEQIMVDVAAVNGSVVFAAYGDSSLAPVHPGRTPFGVTNPIFLSRI